MFAVFFVDQHFGWFSGVLSASPAGKCEETPTKLFSLFRFGELDCGKTIGKCRVPSQCADCGSRVHTGKSLRIGGAFFFSQDQSVPFALPQRTHPLELTYFDIGTSTTTPSEKQLNMATTLSALPSELFSLILHSDISFMAIDLYKCGDALLNHRLRKAELHISLKDHRFGSTSRWPKCLSKFRCLRSLSIVRPDWPILPSSVELRKEIATLAPSLERLELDICDSAGLFDVSVVKADSADSNASFCIADSFVDLRHLLIRSSSNNEAEFVITNESLARQLPVGLSTLCLDLPGSLSGLSNDLAALLPRHLEELSIQVDSLSMAHNLPTSLRRVSYVLDYATTISEKLLPCLENMTIHNLDRNFDFSILPENLKSLEIDYSTLVSWSPEQIASLPRNLELLRGSNLNLDWPALDEMSQNKNENAPKQVSWPPTLATLALSCLSLPDETYLKYLPSTLTSLQNVECKQLQNHYQAPSATSMHTDDDDAESATCLLPKGLKQLHLSGIAAPNHLELPSGLTDLRLDLPTKLKFTREQFALPKSLTRFEARTWHSMWFSNFPASLLEVHVGSIGDLKVQDLEYLPANLRVLELKEGKLQIVKSVPSLTRFTNLHTLTLPSEIVFKSEVLLQVPSTVRHLNMTIHGAPKIDHVQNLSSLVTAQLTSNATPTQELVDNWPLNLDHPIMNDKKDLFQEKKAIQLQKARLYPDPRISSSAMSQ